MQEKDSFLEQHGVVERKEKILELLNEEEREAWKNNEKIFGPIEERLLALEPIQRLNELQQLNGKLIPDKVDSAIIHTPAFHTRFQHCEMFSFLVKVATIKMGKVPEEMVSSLIAAWTHDIGHAAFSHLGDSILVKHGRPNHEQRSIELIKQNQELKNLLAEIGTTKQVENLIMENGQMGQLQSLLDTLSYLVVDSDMAQKDYYADQGIETINSIVGVNDKGLLTVNGTTEIQRLLDNRAEMMNDVYYHPLNRRSDSAMQQLLSIAIARGLISCEEIENSSDFFLRMKLQSLVQGNIDPGANAFAGKAYATTNDVPLAQFKDLFSMSMGFEPENEWVMAEFNSFAEAENFASKDLLNSFIVKPYNYLGKNFNVIDSSKTPPQLTTLVAENIKSNPNDLKFIVYRPKV